MNQHTHSHLPSAGAGSALPSSSSTTDQEVLVKVEGVSKKFCRSLKRSLWYGLCDIAGELSPFGRRDIAEDRRFEMVDGAQSSISHIPYTPAAAARDEDLRDGEFYAVRDVSFELHRGECLGLIGHNGAGKTTLLKMLNGLIKPDTGRIEMNGRVGALIALGAGFNPILTGRENIYINGSVLGLSKKEIDEKIDEIIDFAEIGEFIDSPVQNYSSGMSVRLGFAIASSLDPDVLILDEVLAVGDIGFVIKCLNRVRNMTARAAVILVSHNMQSISSFCSRVMFMDEGTSVLDTDKPSLAIDSYLSLAPTTWNVSGSGEASIFNIRLEVGGATMDNANDITLNQGDEVCVHFDVQLMNETCPEVAFYMTIKDASTAPIVAFVSDQDSYKVHAELGKPHHVTIKCGAIDLNAGKYSIALVVTNKATQEVLARVEGAAPFRVLSDELHWAKILRKVPINLS